MTNTKCTKCGHNVSGKFCEECGTPTTGVNCSSCGSETRPGARFCPGCGTPTGGRPAGGPAAAANRIPWIVAGASIVLLIVVVIARNGMSNIPTVGPAPVGQQTSGLATATTDLTSMSPREQANRLFDRVMGAAERGDSGEVSFFSPMAIQAYENLGPLDTDARYDLGMILSVGGDAASALAQADTIEQSFPNHLLAKVVRATVAQLSGEQETLTAAYRDFLAAFDNEIALDRIEYRAHQRTVESFREEAIASTQ